MPVCDDTFCQILVVRSKRTSLIIFIALALVLEFIVHYQLKISILYTHLFYLIIILAAIWYQRKAVWVALFFGLLHILVTYGIQDSISADSVFRAIMLCFVAFIVGSLVQCMNMFRDEVMTQNQELIKTQAAFLTANKKLNLLSSITRHDILNQLTVLLGYQEIAQELCEEPELLDIMKKEQDAAILITKQIQFTRNYQDIGVKAPVWHNIIENFRTIKAEFRHEPITFESTLNNGEIYADPLFPLICRNLIDNSIRHGGQVRRICFSTERINKDLVLIYQDDGIGVPDDEKEKIFERGYGKHTGMGLFLSQEILAITGLTMRETGVYHKGARFEILIPEGSFRNITDKGNLRSF